MCTVQQCHPRIRHPLRSAIGSRTYVPCRARGTCHASTPLAAWRHARTGQQHGAVGVPSPLRSEPRAVAIVHAQERAVPCALAVLPTTRDQHRDARADTRHTRSVKKHARLLGANIVIKIVDQLCARKSRAHFFARRPCPGCACATVSPHPPPPPHPTPLLFAPLDLTVPQCCPCANEAVRTTNAPAPSPGRGSPSKGSSAHHRTL